jgi:hypothetical protein
MLESFSAISAGRHGSTKRFWRIAYGQRMRRRWLAK